MARLRCLAIFCSMLAAAATLPIDEPEYYPIRIYTKPNSEHVDNPELSARSKDLLEDFPVQPLTEMSREEKAQYLKDSEVPNMVGNGFFDEELCKKWNNCTRAPMVDQHVRPEGVSPGSITLAHRNELTARIDEARLMRWDTHAANAISKLEARRQVCQIINGLQPIVEMVIKKGSPEEIDDATALFSVVCPRVKLTFPNASKELNCNDLHNKTVAYSKLKERSTQAVFNIGSCCNCSVTEDRYQEAKEKLARENEELSAAVARSTILAAPVPLQGDPEIVDKLSSVGARFIEPKDPNLALSDDNAAASLRMRAVSENLRSGHRRHHQGHHQGHYSSRTHHESATESISPELVPQLQRKVPGMNQQTMSPDLVPAPARHANHANMARQTQAPAQEALPTAVVMVPSHESQPARKVLALQDDFSDESEMASQVRQLDSELAEETKALTSSLKAITGSA